MRPAHVASRQVLGDDRSLITIMVEIRHDKLALPEESVMDHVAMKRSLTGLPGTSPAFPLRTP